MKKILFVCLGNICRSPMAEFVMKDLLQRAGLADRFAIDSAATSDEEYGNPIYPPVQHVLTAHGITGFEQKRARPLQAADYNRYDLLIGMDRSNLRGMQRICGGDPQGKLHLLLDFTGSPADVADPWYTRDFIATWNDIQAGCRALLQQLTEEAR